MLEFDTGKKVRPHIGMAPLVDCVFQLLIFFMLSSYFVVSPGIKITLPEATTSKPQDEEIIIFINEDNQIYLGEEKINIEDLKKRLEKKLAISGRESIILKADEKIDLGLAVKVMDIAKEAGVDGLAISTRIKEDVKR